MRKTYMQPQTCVVKLSQTHIIAASSVGISRSTDAADNSESLVKSFNSDIWSDDDY